MYEYFFFHQTVIGRRIFLDAVLIVFPRYKEFFASRTWSALTCVYFIAIKMYFSDYSSISAMYEYVCGKTS